MVRPAAEDRGDSIAEDTPGDSPAETRAGQLEEMPAQGLGETPGAGAVTATEGESAPEAASAPVVEQPSHEPPPNPVVEKPADMPGTEEADTPGTEEADMPGTERVSAVTTERRPPFALLCGSFQDKARAQGEVDRLSALGLKARAHAVQIPEKGIWYRVVTGAFEIEEQAREERSRILANKWADSVYLVADGGSGPVIIRPQQ